MNRSVTRDPGCHADGEVGGDMQRWVRYTGPAHAVAGTELPMCTTFPDQSILSETAAL